MTSTNYQKSNQAESPMCTKGAYCTSNTLLLQLITLVHSCHMTSIQSCSSSHDLIGHVTLNQPYSSHQVT